MDEAETHGQCRCGRLRIRVRGTPLMTMACHCTGCQKMTASAFSLSALFRAEAFAVEAGEMAIGGLHGGHRHHFCAHCLTWAFTRPEGMDDFVNVRTPMLANAETLAPFHRDVHHGKASLRPRACGSQLRAFPRSGRFSGASGRLRVAKPLSSRAERLARVARSCELANQRGPCHDR